jgi:hypothetical protein
MFVVRILLFVASLWLVAVAYVAYSTWPHIPLDLPASDPQVQAAFARAVRAHLGWHAVAACVPPVLFGLVWRMRASGWLRMERRDGTGA